MLAVRRAKGHVAAVVGLASACALAVFVWKMPADIAVNSMLYGAAYGLFPIVWIVITAVWVYNMTVESGEFEIIKDSLARLTDDRRLQAIFKVNWLSAGGTAILLSGLVAVPFMPGYSFARAIKCFFHTWYQLRFPVFTIATILGLAMLMNYSGMSSSLGIGFTMTGGLFPLFAPLLGWLGVFLTGSDTSSNALFCGMQRSTAEVVGMSPELAVASNSSGGVTGKMISPQSIAVATAATNMVGKEGDLFRFTLGHSIAMTTVVCLLTWLQSGPLSFMLP